MKLRGVRGSTPTPYPDFLKTGGNTPCLELFDQGYRVIFDAGTGITQLGYEIMQDPHCFDFNLFFTHYHWDHIQGLPFFVPAFLNNYNIHVHGPGQSGQHVKEIISKQMQPPYFPVETETWLANIDYHKADQSITLPTGTTIEPFAVHHPGATLGYKITTNGQTVIFVPDNELLLINDKANKKLKDCKTKQEADWIKELMKEEQEKVLANFRDADHLIHDAQYTPENYESKRGWGHSCFVDTVTMAMKANVKQLYLYHMDPTYNDDKVDQLERDAKKIVHSSESTMDCEIARETTIIDLT